MSVMVTLSPQMENDVREYVTQDSDELVRLFISYLKKELIRRREARRNPLAKHVGCTADGRRTDDVVSETRGEFSEFCGILAKGDADEIIANLADCEKIDPEFWK